MRKTKRFKKIFARISEADHKRLSEIRERFGFKSNYSIMQYLIHCFLRVADPKSDKQTESIPEEVQAMFKDMSEGEKKFLFEKPIRRCNATKHE